MGSKFEVAELCSHDPNLPVLGPAESLRDGWSQLKGLFNGRVMGPGEEHEEILKPWDRSRLSLYIQREYASVTLLVGARILFDNVPLNAIADMQGRRSFVFIPIPRILAPGWNVSLKLRNMNDACDIEPCVVAKWDFRE